MIIELDQNVNYLLTKSKSIICTNGTNLLPRKVTKKKKKVIKICDTAINYEIPPPQKRKHPFSKRIGSVADMMVQSYRAKFALTDESEEKKEITNIEIVGDVHSFEGCFTCSVFYVCLAMSSF